MICCSSHEEEKIEEGKKTSISSHMHGGKKNIKRAEETEKRKSIR